MTRKIQAVFGDANVTVTAQKGSFSLRIGDSEMRSMAFSAEAHTREEMQKIISDIEDTLTSIRWELNSAYGGFFSGFDPDPKEGPKEAKEEGAEE